MVKSAFSSDVLCQVSFTKHGYTHAHTQSVVGNKEEQLEFPLECIKAVIEEVANHDSKWNILSGETNLSEVSKAVFHEA